VLYAVAYGADELITIDKDTGTASLVGSTAPSNLHGVAFDSVLDGLFAINIVVGPDQLVEVDPTSGATTLIGSFEGIAASSLAARPVPEPTAIAIMLLSGIVIVCHRR
jgi:hypothetical protein